VIKAEKARLKREGRPDLVAAVQDVSDKLNLGYDIESFTKAGAPKRIEVKAAAQRGEDLRFFVSENERRRSETVEGYVFALVTGLDTAEPRILEFDGPKLPTEALYSVSYEVRLKRPPGR
jgi:hypothetical protein